VASINYSLQKIGGKKPLCRDSIKSKAADLLFMSVMMIKSAFKLLAILNATSIINEGTTS
jgi:hypothetical protein